MSPYYLAGFFELTVGMVGMLIYAGATLVLLALTLWR